MRWTKVGVKAKLPTHYYIGAENGLELPSVVLLEQLRTIDKLRLEKYIGRLDKRHISGINHALAPDKQNTECAYHVPLQHLCR